MIQMVEQDCPDTMPYVHVSYVIDPDASTWCRERGANTPIWGGCTTCNTVGEDRYCTVRLPGKPNEVLPEVLADEAQHLFRCNRRQGVK